MSFGTLGILNVQLLLIIIFLNQSVKELTFNLDATILE